MRELRGVVGQSESGQLRYFGVVCLAVLLLGFAGSVFAQQATGNLTGTVTDAQGAAVVGANVQVHNDDTGVDLAPLTTNDSGVYNEPLLQPGTYDVTAGHAGFATVQNKGIMLQVGQTVRIDIMLPVATQQSLVTVTTEAPLIETEKTAQTQNVSEDLVDNLPIGSRRWSEFVLLTPGLSSDGANGMISFHGLSNLYNNNSVDGANNNNSYQGDARGSSNSDGYVYSPDSIREFQVQSSNYTAEQGQAAGGSVNAVTKSGTSQIHGDLFYNGRSPDFNALDPVSKIAAAAAGTIPTQATHQQDQFGGSVGGPLIKDKLFYYVTYDGFRKIDPAVVSANSYTSALACPAEITALQCSTAKGFVTSQVIGTLAQSLTQDVELVKLDYQLNQSNHLSVVANIRDWESPKLATLSQGSKAFIQDRFVIATWDKIFGGDKVNELRYQWGSDDNFSNLNSSNPSVALTSLFTYGDNEVNPQFTDEARHQVSDNFTFTKGNHTFKTGVDMNFIQENVELVLNEGGSYTYSSTVAPPGSGCVNGGVDATFCDWLLDIYGVADSSGNIGRHYTSYNQVVDRRFAGTGPQPAGNDQFTDSDYAGFFQDTWKMRPNVTVNAGLRYDIQAVPPFPNPNLATPLLALYTSELHVDYSGVQPRLGVAWNVAKNTVIRAGGGIFFAKTTTSTFSSARRSSGTREQSITCPVASASVIGTSTNPCGFTAAFPSGLIAPDLLYDQWAVPPFPVFAGAVNSAVLDPAGSCVGNTGCAVRGIDPNDKRPRAYEAEVSFERQLPGNMALTLSYVFTRGAHLPAHEDANMAYPYATKTYDITNTSGTTIGNETVPFFDTRLEPSVGPILAEFSVVNSWYNGFLVTLRKPLGNGVEILANYTLSQALDDGMVSNNIAAGGTDGMYFTSDGVVNPYNQAQEESPSATDARNRGTASVVYHPQYGKGISNKFLKQVVTGWNVSGDITATDGTRFSALQSSSTVQCLVVAASCPMGDLGLDGGIAASVLLTSGTPTPGRALVNARNAIMLPPYTNVDFRLEKQWTIHERYNITLRGEAYNVFNSLLTLNEGQTAYSITAPSAASATCPAALHTNTCLVYTPTSLKFAVPTTTSGLILGARQLQAAIRFEF